ncbi:NAD(P)/FAD-dependent oxidoreductase [Bacillus velezensis]|nr:NAD(P)/FAD-dependent oxidoreductase [Bacillus velezensis]
MRYENGRTAGITTNNDEHINADAVIIAVGGKSVPHTGKDRRRLCMGGSGRSYRDRTLSDGSAGYVVRTVY